MLVDAEDDHENQCTERDKNEAPRVPRSCPSLHVWHVMGEPTILVTPNDSGNTFGKTKQNQKKKKNSEERNMHVDFVIIYLLSFRLIWFILPDNTISHILRKFAPTPTFDKNKIVGKIKTNKGKILNLQIL